MREPPPEPVAKLLEAANANDIDAFLATFAADGVVDDWGREFVGPAAIRAWSDREFIGQHVTLEVGDVRTDGGVTVVAADVGGQGFHGPSHFSFTLRAGHVSRMTIRE
jgi:hypothetical protein